MTCGRQAAVLLAFALSCIGCSESPPAEAGADAHVADLDAASLDIASTDGVGAPMDASATGDSGQRAEDALAPPTDGVQSDGGADPGPPYPIVLAHGFFGFEAFAGMAFATYFHGVRADLTAHGESEVFTPAVDPFNSSTARGKQLIAHIETILASTGRERVVVIGHSQGGLDARVAAHLRPDLVAAVVTYATPNHGSPIADIAMKLLPNDQLQQLLDALAKLIGGPLYDKVGASSSLVAGIKQFTSAEIAVFNGTYVNSSQVAYYSVTGRSDHRIAAKPCAPDKKVDFINKWAAQTDPIDPLLAIQEALIDGKLGLEFPNDGMVRVEDARWGTFLGCVPADHLDEVGHLLGDKPGLLNAWSHKKFFRNLVDWLREQGH